MNPSFRIALTHTSKIPLYSGMPLIVLMFCILVLAMSNGKDEAVVTSPLIMLAQKWQLILSLKYPVVTNTTAKVKTDQHQVYNQTMSSTNISNLSIHPFPRLSGLPK